MIINQIYSIDSCDDVELNIKRGSKLEFRLTYDDSKEIEAIEIGRASCRERV